MKIIRTNSYIRKEAGWDDLPVGDPGLPGDLRERDIPGGNESTGTEKHTGETETSTYHGLGPYYLYYDYDYDRDEDWISNLRITKAQKWEGNQYGPFITDPNLLNLLAEVFEDKIEEDIRDVEKNYYDYESARSDPFELDRHEDF